MTRPDTMPKVLTKEETERFLAQPNQRYFGPHQDYLFMRLMLDSGLRTSEAVALHPEHLDMTTCKLMVREGKGAKDRVGPFLRKGMVLFDGAGPQVLGYPSGTYPIGLARVETLLGKPREHDWNSCRFCPFLSITQKSAYPFEMSAPTYRSICFENLICHSVNTGRGRLWSARGAALSGEKTWSSHKIPHRTQFRRRSEQRGRSRCRGRATGKRIRPLSQPEEV